MLSFATSHRKTEDASGEVPGRLTKGLTFFGGRKRISDNPSPRSSPRSSPKLLPKVSEIRNKRAPQYRKSSTVSYAISSSLDDLGDDGGIDNVQEFDKPDTKRARLMAVIRRFSIGKTKQRVHSEPQASFSTKKDSFIHGNLPRGVDLNYLLNLKVCLDTPYINAYIESGGESRQRAYESRMRCLMEKVEQCNDASLRVQDPIFQMHDLLTVVQETTCGELRKYGEQQLQQLQADLRLTVHKDIHVEIPACKSVRRAELKARIKYGNDVSHLVDLNRATIQCPDMPTMLQVTERCVDIFGVSDKFGNPDTAVVDIEDSWFTGPPKSANYRQIQLLTRFRGVIWEIQINTAPMLREKHDGGGHKYYVTTRYVQESILLAAVLGLGSQLREFFAHTGVRQVADCDQITDKNGLTALHHAAFRDDVDIGETLLNQNANPWILDKNGRPPIYYTLAFHRTKMGDLLVAGMLKKTPDEQLQWSALRPCLPYCNRMPESLATLLSAPAMATYLQEEYRILADNGGGSEMLLLFRASKVPLDHEDRKLRFLIVLQELVETLGSAQGGVEMVAAFVLALAPGWDFDWHTQLMPLDPVSVQTFLVRLGEQLLLDTWHWQPRIKARKVKFAHNKLGTRSCGEAIARILRRCEDTKEIDFKECDLGPAFLQGFAEGYKPLLGNTRKEPLRRNLELHLRSNPGLADARLGNFLTVLAPDVVVLFECDLSWSILKSITMEPKRVVPSASRTGWCRTVTKLTLSYNVLRAAKDSKGAFWTLLGAMPQLTELCINRCLLGPSVFACGENVQVVSSTLKKLDLSENPFLGMKEGGEALANIFQCCDSLAEINLTECDLGPAMVTLTEKMHRHECLTHLVLDKNPMVASFAKNVGRFLAFVPRVHHICMDQCGWNPEHFETFLTEPWKTLRLNSMSIRGLEEFDNNQNALTLLLKRFRLEKCQNICVEINVDKLPTRE